MRQLAKSWCSHWLPRSRPFRPQGFLLVEATLTAVVIAVGLVGVSQAISRSLKALAGIQDYDRLLRVAESTLQALEAKAQHQLPLGPREGSCELDERYHCALIDQPPPEDLSAETIRLVTLTVKRQDAPAPLVRLSSLWPQEWLAQ